jgi:hypothetical protein
MDVDWLTSSNPVAAWWSFLLIASSANVALFLRLRARFRKATTARRTGAFVLELLLLLSAVYVFGCAFRSVLPRADVQRICLFDTWLSSVFVGRSVATIAELCFALQWAIVLRRLGNFTNSDTARNIAKAIVPLIALAECCSWYAVITTNYLGNVLENSLWTATFALVAVALLRLVIDFRGLARLLIGAAAAGTAAYVAFMCAVDVPMYVLRWQADAASGRQFFGLFGGLYDAATHWTVSHNFADWKDEIPWMSLYFSMAVWTSLALGAFGLVAHLLPRYRVRPGRNPRLKPSLQPSLAATPARRRHAMPAR